MLCVYTHGYSKVYGLMQVVCVSQVHNVTTRYTPDTKISFRLRVQQISYSFTVYLHVTDLNGIITKYDLYTYICLALYISLWSNALWSVVIQAM